MTEREKEKEMIARFDTKTSGLFNAGLTPCSHTTTTKEC